MRHFVHDHGTDRGAGWPFRGSGRPVISPQETGSGHVRVIRSEEQGIRFMVADKIRELAHENAERDSSLWQHLTRIAAEIEEGR
jgi:hypothetical protein